MFEVKQLKQKHSFTKKTNHSNPPLIAKTKYYLGSGRKRDMRNT